MVLSADYFISSNCRSSARYIAVIAPNFREVLSSCGSTLDALDRLYVETQLLAETMEAITLRNQGKIMMVAQDYEHLREVKQQVSLYSSSAEVSVWMKEALNRVSYVDLRWVDLQWPDMDTSSRFALAHYLCLQAARLGGLVGSGWRDARCIEKWFHCDFGTDAAIGDVKEAMRKSLYAVALGGLQEPTVLDDLERWHLASRIWPTKGYVLQTDIHDTERIFSPDLDNALSRYLDRKISFFSLISESLVIRQSHNLLLERYFAQFQQLGLRMFRASGDGIVGFVESLEEVRKVEFTASRQAVNDIASGVAAVPITHDSQKTRRDLELALTTTKLMKSHPIAATTSFIVGSTIRGISIVDLLDMLALRGRVAERDIFRDFWSRSAVGG
ncbi:hypothetical protein [Paenarthrobacter sp. 2TAF44]|uniref:hypothetical protein n=1 Tax=Paenarthrobacter sp. 2TAF44 TaxID=3233018 RepID=UPI003F9AE8F6